MKRQVEAKLLGFQLRDQSSVPLIVGYSEQNQRFARFDDVGVLNSYAVSGGFPIPELARAGWICQAVTTVE